VEISFSVDDSSVTPDSSMEIVESVVTSTSSAVPNSASVPDSVMFVDMIISVVVGTLPSSSTPAVWVWPSTVAVVSISAIGVVSEIASWGDSGQEYNDGQHSSTPRLIASQRGDGF